MAIVSLFCGSVPLVLLHNLKLIENTLRNDKGERKRGIGGKNGKKSAPDLPSMSPNLSPAPTVVRVVS
jgi:hypothetical protein